MIRRLALSLLFGAALVASAPRIAAQTPPTAAPERESSATAGLAAGQAGAPAVESPRRERRRRAIEQRAAERASAVEEAGRTLGDRIVKHLPGVAAGIALFLFFYLLARLAGRVLRKVFARAETDPTLAQLTVPLIRMSILGLGAIIAVEQMGFNVGSLLAGVGIAGLAIGLAAQETLANLLAGFALLWDRPFRLGDDVTVGGRFGTVTEIGLRSTRLRTLERLEVTIPNKEVAQQQIVNHSRYPEIRINVPVTVGFREDLARIRRLLLGAVADHAEVLAEPAPRVVVTGLADSAVSIELRVWVKTPVAESASLFALFELVKARFDAEGIELPYPQRTVHLAEPLRAERGARPGGTPAPGPLVE